MSVGVNQHQVLHHEFDVHHAATVVLDVEQAAGILVAVVHFLAHLQNLLAQCRRIALLAKHLLADLLKGRADPAIARTEAGACQRLMLPDPGMIALILGKRRN